MQRLPFIPSAALALFCVVQLSNGVTIVPPVFAADLPPRVVDFTILSHTVPSSIDAGKNASVFLTVRNLGGKNAQTARVIHGPVHAPLVFDADHSSNDCHQDGDAVICETELTGYQTRYLTLNYRVTADGCTAGEVTFNSRIEGPDDVNGSNNERKADKSTKITCGSLGGSSSSSTSSVSSSNSSSSSSSFSSSGRSSSSSSVRRPDFSVTSHTGPASVRAGGYAQFALTVRNLGNKNADEVRVIHGPVGTPFTFDAGRSHSKCALDGDAVVCKFSLTAYQTQYLSIYYHVEENNCQSAQRQFTARVEGPDDANNANNEKRASSPTKITCGSSGNSSSSSSSAASVSSSSSTSSSSSSSAAAASFNQINFGTQSSSSSSAGGSFRFLDIGGSGNDERIQPIGLFTSYNNLPAGAFGGSSYSYPGAITMASADVARQGFKEFDSANGNASDAFGVMPTTGADGALYGGDGSEYILTPYERPASAVNSILHWITVLRSLASAVLFATLGANASAG